MMILAARSTQVVLSQGNIRGYLSTSPLPVSIIYSSNNIVCRTNNWEGVFWKDISVLHCIGDDEDLDEDVGGYQITS